MRASFETLLGAFITRAQQHRGEMALVIFELEGDKAVRESAGAADFERAIADLGRELRRGASIHWPQMHRKAGALLDSFGVRISTRAPVKSLHWQSGHGEHFERGAGDDHQITLACRALGRVPCRLRQLFPKQYHIWL